MKRTIACAIGALVSMTALGQDLFECLGPDLVRSLVAPTTTNNDIPITAQMPPELTELPLPDSLEWIGMISGEIRKTAAFKSALPSDEAIAAAIDWLEAAGWESAPMPGMTSPFVQVGVARPAARLCWNGQDGSLAVRDVDGARFLNLVYSAPGAQSSSCNLSRLSSRPPSLDAMGEQMPSLRFPDGTRQSGGMSGGGSSRDQRVSTQVASQESPEALVAFISRQMAEQGWVADSSWAGRRGAGATWSRPTESDEAVLGTIEILVRADAMLDVQFRVRML